MILTNIKIIKKCSTILAICKESVRKKIFIRGHSCILFTIGHERPRMKKYTRTDDREITTNDHESLRTSKNGYE